MSRRSEGRLIGHKAQDELLDFAFATQERVAAIKVAYVRALSVHGIYGKAARQVGVSDRVCRSWRTTDPEFAADVHDAVEEALDKAEEKLNDLLESARDDVALKAAMFLLANKRKEIYGMKVEVEQKPQAPRYVSRVPRAGIIDITGSMSVEKPQLADGGNDDTG